MPVHTKLLRTLGLKTRDNFLAANMIAGGDVATLSLLISFGRRLAREDFHDMLRLFDGNHIYGPNIYRMMAKSREKNFADIVGKLVDGKIKCSQCGRRSVSGKLLAAFDQEEDALYRLARSLPEQSLLSGEANMFFNLVWLSRYQSEKGCLEFFAQRYGEVRIPRDMLHMLDFR